jgi:hypothetical protein
VLLNKGRYHSFESEVRRSGLSYYDFYLPKEIREADVRRVDSRVMMG